MRIFDNSYGKEKYIIPLDSNAADYAARESISNMFTYLDDFMNTLMLELDRINISNKKLETMCSRRIVKFEERFCFTTLWADYYFFLNTVDRTYRLAMELYKALGETEKEKRIRQSDVYNNARKIRNTIEHLYENLNVKRSDFYKEHRSMAGDNEIIIGDTSFKANEDSLQVLYQIYDDISNAIEQRYVVPNKEIADRLMP